VKRRVASGLEQRLDMYALAASAAGVGVLALAQPAEARIVYTPVHHQIWAHQSFPLDFNHDGAADFVLANDFQEESAGFLKIYSAQRLSSRSGMNRIWGNEFVSALRSGVRVGPKGRFQLDPLVLGGWIYNRGAGTRTSGYWLDAKDRYVGLKFEIEGKMHYGWARLNVNVEKRKPVTAVLTGYAFGRFRTKQSLRGGRRVRM
jgi:hypothetical protein